LFYVWGIASFYYLGIYHIKDTNYDHAEEGAVVPNHILAGENLTPGQQREATVKDTQVEGQGAVRVSEQVEVNEQKV